MTGRPATWRRAWRGGTFGAALTAALLLGAAPVGLAETSLPLLTTARQVHQLSREEAARGYRVELRGVVTYYDQGIPELFINDDTEGVFIEIAEYEGKLGFQPAVGQVLEVLGITARGGFSPDVIPRQVRLAQASLPLQDAEFRKIGAEAAPEPISITASEGFRDKYDAMLVQLEATLLSRVLRERDEVLELQASNFIFHASLYGPIAPQDSLAAIPNRSKVRLTGVCLVPADPYRLDKLPQSFSLLLRSASDVVVLERPSWWTAEHTLWVLAGTVAVFCLSLAWVAMLRRQVKAQTKLISQKVQREAALEERTRIARDLHDDLGAGLTRIAFLSEVAQKEGEPPLVKENLREISGSAQDSFQALDEIVWVVNPRNDTLDGLANYICHFAERFFQGSPTRCRLNLPASLPDYPISTEVRNNLFLAGKEALNNVHKHARASEVVVRIRLADGVFSLSIEDDGRGFLPGQPTAKGNGLHNMRKRLERIGGGFELVSQPQEGTRIRLSVTTGVTEAASRKPAGTEERR